MSCTIHINGNSDKAKSIINFLKTLEQEYDFIEIVEEDQVIYPETDELLRERYKKTIENPEGKDWKGLKDELLT